MHRDSQGDWNALAQKTDVSTENLHFFLEYATQFLGNCGNYKGFGDSKFIPRIPQNAFQALSSSSPESSALFSEANSTGGGIYETENAGLMHLGYPEGGHMTTYYPDSNSITKEEITLIGSFLEKKGLLLENTRLRKTSTGDFQLLIASGLESPSSTDWDVDANEWNLEDKLQGKKLTLVFGDHHKELAEIAESIKQAGLNADNDIQKKMHAEYQRSFATGSLEAFKESQRYWIQDKGPMVESDIGFVETYRDPHGVRGEWEGFVAMVSVLFMYDEGTTRSAEVRLLLTTPFFIYRSTRSVHWHLGNLWKVQRA